MLVLASLLSHQYVEQMEVQLATNLIIAHKQANATIAAAGALAEKVRLPFHLGAVFRIFQCTPFSMGCASLHFSFFYLA